MFKSIKHMSNAIADLTVIVAKETCHQISSANECCTDMTRMVAWKAGQIRNDYEDRLSRRQRKTLMLEHIPQEQDQ